MGLYPIFLKLDSVPCVVVGGGVVAERKVRSLLDAQARVTVVSPEVTSGIGTLAEAKRIFWLKRSYARGDLEGSRLAIAATDSREVNRLVFEEATERGIPVNSVDDPENSSFFVPAVARTGSLMLAVSTSGIAPYAARRLKEYLESKLYPGLESDLEKIQRARARILGQDLSAEEKSRLMRQELQPLVNEIIEKMERS
jgi:precorrin-2 dehydrogenase / sirohydrochlorin ferrochelatase